jgi:thiol-disulfide isomerase/thioredoxin
MNRRTLFFLPVALAAAACTSASASRARAAGPTPVSPAASANKAALPDGPVAPAIQSAQWLNTKPLAWDGLRGRVVMVEFWTFGCINCKNVTPALKDMHADFKDEGFTLIGVHSPEFDYEKKLANVQKAVKDAGITYPVAIDNDFANWRRYRNRYWPAIYLVDKRGVIRYTHIGEGRYEETRRWIELLLNE